MNSAGKLLTGAGILAAVSLPVFLVAPGRATKRQKSPFMYRNFAHRGLHSQDKTVPENSMEAFRLATRAGLGIELDVQLSKDGQVVVFHDSTLDRVCGVNARVDEKSYDELKTLSLCGSEHRIPLFSEVLKLIDGRGPLIVELKNGRRNKELCRKVYELLQDYTGAVCIESFDPTIVSWFRFHAGDILRGQLAQPAASYKGETSPALARLLSRCLLNFLARPQFIAYKIGKRPLCVKLANKLGAMNVGWTSHDAANEKGRDGIIFEFYNPQVKYR